MHKQLFDNCGFLKNAISGRGRYGRLVRFMPAGKEKAPAALRQRPSSVIEKFIIMKSFPSVFGVFGVYAFRSLLRGLFEIEIAGSYGS